MNDSSRPLIIINPAAARSRRAWPIICSRLDENRIHYEVRETETAGHATSLSRAALEAGTQLIAVVGGDGTLSEAAAGFFKLPEAASGPSDAMPLPISRAAALAILPAGTGDDFARNLAGRRAPLDHWIDAFIAHCHNAREHTTRVVDVIRARVDDYARHVICINASTLGLGGETAARVAAQGKSMRRLSGEARFVAAALGALAAWRERPVRVSIDGEQVIEGPMNLVAVGNARYAGGGMMLSPDAEMDDGRLDVATASRLSRATIMRELTRIHKGGHVANPKVRIAQGSHVSIHTAPKDSLRIEIDGNVCGRTPADYQIMRGALRVVA